MRAAIEHLEAKTSTGESYFKKVDDSIMKEAKDKIIKIVKEAYDNEILSKDEYQSMLSQEDETPVAERFYCTVKFTKTMKKERPLQLEE